MKFNKWTLGLAAVGAVSLASAARADEKMTQVQTALSNTTLSGYVDFSAVWRPGTDANANTGAPGNMPLYAFAKNDGFYLDAIDVALDKPLDESPWASGYHVELMGGSDAVPGISVDSNGDTSGIGGISIRQAYLALRTPIGNSGIDWKLGVFDTIIGYESNSGPLNPNFTHSYGYTIEPTTHTGIVGTYKVNDVLSVTAGIANSANVTYIGGPVPPPPVSGTAAYESQKTYLAAIALTAPDAAGWLKGATLNAGIVHRIDSTATVGSTDNYYVGATAPTPVTALKVGASFDYLHAAPSATPGNAWDGALYAAFQVNDKTSLNLRAEYGEDDWGILYGSSPWIGQSAVTATLQYNIWANVISRVEFRWDHVNSKVFGVSSTTGNAFRKNDFMLALNVAYQF